MSLYLLDISDIHPFSQNYTSLLQLLTQDEADQITTKRTTKQVFHALASRLFQKYALAEAAGNVLLHEVIIERTKYNKPVCALAEFNTSHDGNWIVVVTTEKKNGFLGVDLTRRNKEAEFKGDLEFLEMCLAGSETARVRSCRALAAVYWCIKESFLKYLGTGLLNTELHEIEIVLPEKFEEIYNQSLADHDASLGENKQFSWLEHSLIEVRLVQVPQTDVKVGLFALGPELVGSVCFGGRFCGAEPNTSFDVHYVTPTAILAEAN